MALRDSPPRSRRTARQRYSSLNPSVGGSTKKKKSRKKNQKINLNPKIYFTHLEDFSGIFAPWFVWIIVRYGGGICIMWFFLIYSWVPAHRFFSFTSALAATAIPAPDHLKIESSSQHEIRKLWSKWNRLEFRETFDDTRFCSNNFKGDIGLGGRMMNFTIISNPIYSHKKVVSYDNKNEPKKW